MAIPSPRRSPARLKATGAARPRASAPRNLVSSYRNVCGGVEMGRTGSLECASAVSSMDLSLRADDHRTPRHIQNPRRTVGRFGQDPRCAQWGASMIVTSRGSYGCSGGAPPYLGAPSGWESAPVDLLQTIFKSLNTAAVYWAVTHVCSHWRFVAFLLVRPMSLAMSATVLDPLPFPLTPMKLLIAKPSIARDGTMETGRIFGYHNPSAFFGIPSDSRLIGTFSGIPLFLSQSGQLELPSIVKSYFSQLIAQRYALPLGVDASAVYLGILNEDMIAAVMDGSLLMSRGTAPGSWLTIPFSNFLIDRITSIAIVNGVVYLLDDRRRLFRAQFLAFSVSMAQVDLIIDLPPRQPWERLWLIKCPTAGCLMCLCYREIGRRYEFMAFDLLEEEAGSSWIRKDNFGDVAVFVNWGLNTLGFAHGGPERWCLRRNHVYHSHKGISCRLNQAYEGRIMPREQMRWPFPVWMLAGPSELDIADHDRNSK